MRCLKCGVVANNGSPDQAAPFRVCVTLAVCITLVSGHCFVELSEAMIGFSLLSCAVSTFDWLMFNSELSQNLIG